MSRPRVFVIHLLAWVIYILLYATLWRGPGETFEVAMIRQGWLLPPKLFLVYVALLILVPRFFLKRRYALFFLTLIATSLLGGLLNQVFVFYIAPGSVELAGPAEQFWDVSRISKRLTYINSTLLFALTAEGIRMSYEQREANARLVKEKMAAELSLLRTQLQPHFFFNTLNHLYSLSLQKSDQAPQFILQISDLMRYIITSSRLDRVSLLEEVNFIRDYVGIESVRYAGKVKVDAIFPENMDNIFIPPLTLFTFVENAFKHGVAEETGSGWIRIFLQVKNGSLEYHVKNSYPESGHSNSSAGVGLRNTQERLFIEYGRDMIFTTQKSKGVFEAYFMININKRRL